MKAQIEAEPKAEAKTASSEEASSLVPEETEAGEDPVDAALAKYGIICENPWEKGVK